MGFFDFLRDANREKQAASKAFHFLGGTGNTTVRQQLQTQTKTTPQNSPSRPVLEQASQAKPNSNLPRAALKTVTQAIAPVPERIGRSFIQAQTGISQRTNVPTDPIRKALYGNNPVKTYQQGYSETVPKLQKKGFGVAASPLAFLGTALTAGTDITGFGGVEKTIGKEGVEQLVKATTTNEVKRIIGKRLAPEVVDKVAPAIAQTKDKNIINNLIRGKTDVVKSPEVNIPPPVKPSPSLSKVSPETPPTPVASDILSVGKGSVQKVKEPIDNLVNATIPKVSTPSKDILTAGKPGEVKSLNIPTREEISLPTKESGLKKAILSNTGLISRQGESGKRLAESIGGRRDTQEILQGAIERAIPSLKNIKKIGKDSIGKNELANLSDIVEGKLTASSPGVKKLVDEVHQVMPQLLKRAKSAGVDAGDLGPNYYPHIIDVNKIFKNKANYNEAIGKLTAGGRTPKEAQGLLDWLQSKSEDGLFIPGVRPPSGSGNLKFSRTANLPLYDKSSEALGKYFNSVTKRIARAENYGPNYEKAKELLKGIRAEGGDTAAVRKAFTTSEGAGVYGEGAQKVAGAAQQVQAVTKLGLSALTNVTQQVNTGIVSGYINQLKGASKLASKEGKEFVAKTGVVSDNVIHNLQNQAGFRGVLSRVTAPGFRAIERLNREVSSLTGREWANDLAKKAASGDEEALKTLTDKLGVKGTISKNLTEAQQIQAGRKLTELTQFKADPQDLPAWTNSPSGQVVSQLRKFSYKQQGFIWNQILKPIKTSGDFKPLARLLAAIGVVGVPAAGLRDKLQNKKDTGESAKWREIVNAWQKVGGGGLATDVISGFIPREGSKLPADVITSRIIGTAGGPTASTTFELTKDLSNAVLGNVKPLARFGVRNIPVAGATAANTLFPYTGLSDKQNETIKKLSDKNQQEAYKQFYLTAKKSSKSRTEAMDAIKKVIQTDEDKAVQIAEAYNQQYANSFKNWDKKYGKYGDDTINEEYSSRKITDASLERILASLAKENQ